MIELPGTELHLSTAQIVRRSGTSFFWAMRSLPREKRTAMYAIYSFCRVVDDIADEQGDQEEKRLSLDWWRTEIDNLYCSTPTHIITRELLESVGLYNLKKQDFYGIIDGMVMDVTGEIRIQSLKELEIYCDRVACAVGRLAVRVFGMPEKMGLDLAFAQGQAMQITNILRDIGEDFGQNRVYLPLDILDSHGIKFNKLSDIIQDPRLIDVCKHLTEIAEQRYSDARKVMAKCDRSIIRPARMMLEFYHILLKKQKKQGWVDINSKVSLSKLETLNAIFRYGIF